MDLKPPSPPPAQLSFVDYKTPSSFQNDRFTGRNDNTVGAGDDASGNNPIRASIAERRAAKCGFNAERINTARFRTTSPLASPVANALRSPCITIPPGISPTALLDSPIMLHNSQASPTTGTFPLPIFDYESSMLNTVSPADRDKGSNAGSSFRLKPCQDPASMPGISNVENEGFEEPFEFPAEFSKEATTDGGIRDSVANAKDLNIMAANTNFNDVQMCHFDIDNNQSSLQKEPVHGKKVGIHHTPEEQKGMPSTGIGRTSDDGYNWRKYGQKQVKGSEYPRSYYKCTHPNCLVKKIIEHSHDGQIIEIIYKGGHTHPKPQPNRRAPIGSTSSFDETAEMEGGSGICSKVESAASWKNLQSGSTDFKLSSDRRTESSTSVVTELSDLPSTTQVKSVGMFESAGTPEFSSTLDSHDEDDEGATHRNILLGVDADGYESESKRRKIENCLGETNISSRAVREPRVVVQIESEVDILDDGYRWRKYGQKVVKGNPNPRSYYKCTSAGCLVRKHVERASHNLKYVITTYEGKHNHEVPAARNSGQLNSSGSNLTQATANSQPALAFGRHINGAKPGTQLQDFTPGFDRKPVFNTDYYRTSFPCNFSNDMKLGASSLYAMKFPPVQNSMSYVSSGFNSNGGVNHHSGSIASFIPDFPISMPPNLQTPGSFPLVGVDFHGNGKQIGQVHSYNPGQQLIRPKQEQKDDNLCNVGLPILDQVNASSSAYQQIMGDSQP